MAHNNQLKLVTKLLTTYTLVAVMPMLNAQDKPAATKPFVANYDESKVPPHSLPPILSVVPESVETARAAWQPRRAELLKLFTDEMFGSYPTSPYELDCQEVESGPAFEGKALRQQFAVTVKTSSGSQRIDLLVYSPSNPSKPVPCFLGLNFRGNHTVNADPKILIPETWAPKDDEAKVVDNKSTEGGRGTSSRRWECEMLIENGCAVATAYCGDIDPDFDDQFQNGIHALFPEHRPSAEHPERWGTIAAWSWGLSRLLDCLELQAKSIDPKRVAVIGHSRLGKTSLWAGATDTRFAAVLSNNSGCGGAAISRREFGETVWRINNSFPHWFCGNFKKYSNNEANLPFDQHQLLALAAPRPLYVASASEDLWADPKGEFVAAQVAGELYKQLGGQPLAIQDFPAPGTAMVGQVSYHLREGKHDILAWDWKNYIEFIKLLK
jgi:hypothetical protein